MRAPSLRISVIAAAFCVTIASVLLAGCGTASATTSANASATCPPQASFKTVTGKITSTGSGSIAVTDSQGKVTQVQVSSTTRLTQIAHPAATSLATGTSVLVLTDTNATVAQRINVLGAGANGSGSGGFGFGSGSGRPTGTPSASARANARCFQRTGQRFGQGTPGAGNGNGNGGGAFQGIQGTIDTINGSHLTFHDAQGQEYSVAITSTTVIQQTAQAKASDLKVGMNVAVVGSASSNGIAARTIAIQG